MPSTTDAAIERLARGLGGLGRYLKTGRGRRRLLDALGWELPPGLTDIGLAKLDPSPVTSRLTGVATVKVSGTSIEVAAAYSDLSAAVSDFIAKLGTIGDTFTAPADYLARTHIADEFFPRLFDFIVSRTILEWSPFAYLTGQLVGIFSIEPHEPDVVNFQTRHLRIKIHWDRMGTLLTDPALLFRQQFGWGKPGIGADALMVGIGSIIRLVGFGGFTSALPLRAEGRLLGKAVIGTGVEPSLQLFVSLVKGLGASPLDVGVTFYALRPSAPGGVDGGFGLSPYVRGTNQMRHQLEERLWFELDSSVNVQSGVAVLVRPGQSPRLMANLNTLVTGSPAQSADLVLSVRHEADADRRVGLLSVGDLVRIDGTALSIGGGVRGGALVVEAGIEGGRVVIGTEDADGFLAKFLPDNGISADFDVLLQWSSLHGVRLNAGGGLLAALPIHQQLGPFQLDVLTLSLKPITKGLAGEVSVVGRFALPPLAATVDGVGAQLELRYQPGSLGPVDLAVRFKPPNRIGLSINAAAVTGGGYLKFDPVRGEYAGALELQLAEFLTVKAIGIITTKLPDGSNGYSLLIILSEDFGPGIQLGLGFKLLAVGGLLGLHRRMDRAALTEGVRSGAITSVMFPQDIIANAPKIVSDLRTFFPVREDTFLIGPMVKLGWGTPTLVTISVAVIMEIPGDIALLGVLRAALPSDDVAVIVLQAHIDGTIELDKKRAYFVAQLFESHVVFLPLDGRIGVFVAYGDDPNFIITVGGFHPKFEPPALPFEVPERISVSLLNSSKARVSVQGYLAITSNTVQAGARVEVFFGLSKLNVKGHLGFDALLQISPLHFTAEISASLSANVFGKGIFSVRVRGKLSGPTPWHIKGHGSISVLFWDIDVNIKKTWGDDRDTQLPPIAILPLLQAELSKPQAWRAIPPDTSRLLVTLRPLGPTETAQVLHPTGVLRVSQRAVPLDLTLTRVGSQQPSDVNRVTLTVTSGGLVSKADTHEQFAPAQFTDHSDADKLSLPAFSKQHSGLDLAPAGADTRTSQAVKRVVRYEEIVIDKTLTPDRRRFRAFPAVLFAFFLGGNSVARSPISKAHKDRLQPFTDRATVTDDTYVVALQATNRPYTPTATFVSAASAHDHLARTLAHDPTLVNVLHVIPGFEANT